MILLQIGDDGQPLDPEPSNPINRIVDSLIPNIPLDLVLIVLAYVVSVAVIAFFVWVWIHRFIRRRRARKMVGNDYFILAMKAYRWEIRTPIESASGVRGKIGALVARIRDSLRRRIVDLSVVWGPLRPTVLVKIRKNLSLLVSGMTRSGKTETLKVIARQILADFSGDVASVYLETKDDFQEFSDKLEQDYIVISLNGSTHIPNLFEEVRKPGDFDVITERFFSSNNPYFQSAPRQVLVACMKLLVERNDPDDLSNKVLVDFIKSHDAEGLDELMEKSPNDYTTAQAHLGSSGDRTGSVMGTLHSQIDNVFRGDFGADPEEEGKPSFSVSEWVENPRGRHLIIQMPSDMPSSVMPMYRFFIDRGIELALRDKDRSHWILDEFAAIEGLENIERLANAGAGQNVQAAFGVQGISQLDAMYGSESGARKLLIGMGQAISHRSPSDDDTAEIVQRRMGEQRKERSLAAERDDGEITADTEIPATYFEVGKGELTSLRDGHAIVTTPSRGWMWGRVLMYTEIRWLFDKIIPLPSVDSDGEPDSEPEPESESEPELSPDPTPEMPGPDVIPSPESETATEPTENPEQAQYSLTSEEQEVLELLHLGPGNDEDESSDEWADPDLEPDPDPEPESVESVEGPETVVETEPEQLPPDGEFEDVDCVEEPDTAEIDTTTSDAERAVAGDSSDSGETGISGMIVEAVNHVEDSPYGDLTVPEDVSLGVPATSRDTPAADSNGS